MKTRLSLIIGVFVMCLLSCDQKTPPSAQETTPLQDVEMITDYGTIILRLSDETPAHRDNFTRLVNEQFYDSIQFHRIIEQFLVQAGNHKTKSSYEQMKKDSVPLPDLVPAEFPTSLFHKRGALNAARMGDDTNPSRASDGSQFTIVQGKVQTDSMLDYSLGRVNTWLSENNVINRPQYKTDIDELVKIASEMDEIDAYDTVLTKEKEEEMEAAYLKVEDQLKLANFDSLAQIELATMKKYSYPESHREVYKTIGGAPHLDQNYTVFGEVIQGMNVVDSIATVATDDSDKPIKDVYIISARMVKRKF